MRRDIENILQEMQFYFYQVGSFFLLLFWVVIQGIDFFQFWVKLEEFFLFGGSRVWEQYISYFFNLQRFFYLLMWEESGRVWSQLVLQLFFKRGCFFLEEVGVVFSFRDGGGGFKFEMGIGFQRLVVFLVFFLMIFGFQVFFD